METLKNIAAILGAILSLSAVITLCCKPIKLYIANALKKYQSEQDDKIKQSKCQQNMMNMTVILAVGALLGWRIINDYPWNPQEPRRLFYCR